VLFAGLATGHKIALIVAAGVFIGFSLVSAFVMPRRNPDFPGRGAGIYYVVTVLLFIGMIGSIEVFGAEGPETASSAVAETTGPDRGTIQVSEREWRIVLPASTATTLRAGVYDFHVVNKGQQVHNLTVDGPQVDKAHTPNLQPGQSADLKVKLVAGSYDLYCSIPGHKELGMDAKLLVG
jgi:hypothetical protein